MKVDTDGRDRLREYQSGVDALAHFHETVTAIGVNLDASGRLKLAAPYGIDDIVKLQLRPTPAF
ncbi:nucleotidyltransferase family protein, partial [Acinetobacter soli]